MNTSQKTEAELNSLDHLLNQTDIGQFIGKYKLLLSLLFGVIIIGVVAQGIYSNVSNKKVKAYSAEIHAFETGAMKDFLEKKIDQQAVISAHGNLLDQIESFSGAGLITLELAREIGTRGDKAAAAGVLQTAHDRFTNPYVHFFITSNLAALREDLGQWEKAKVLHESLLESPVRVFEEKIYLDLGRTYLKLNNNEKAKASFQYVLDKGEEAELKKLAGLYMEQLK